MHSGLHIGGRWLGLAVLMTAVVCLPLSGCGSSGSDGAPGEPGSSTGTLTGSVKNSMTGSTMSGVTVNVPPLGTFTTNGSGVYTVEAPVGLYAVECAPSNYEEQTQPGNVLAAQTTTVDFDMDPVAGAVVMIGGAPASPAPGSSFPLSASAQILDGSTDPTYMWKQLGVAGPLSASEGGGSMAPVMITNGDTANPTITLPGDDAYKMSLRSFAHAPERWDVLPFSPFGIEEGTGVMLQCDVTTTSGTYSTVSTFHVSVDFAAVASGLRNVPRNVPVMMNGKSQGSYDWSFVSMPNGTATTLDDADTVNPYFVPDTEGVYVLGVTDMTEEGLPYQEIPVYVGNWDGGIVKATGGQEPLSPDGWTTTCTNSCHAGVHNDKFVDWAQTGHAHIFTNMINTGGHYGNYCFSCHTVGFDPSADNNGMDEASDYDAFFAAMFPGNASHPAPDNYDRVLTEFPATAEYTNIQCENCHGPNGQYGNAHAWTAPTVTDFSGMHPRIDVRADVCATCHGEPLRHARYQQWELSGHANYELAMDEATAGGGSCADCHTAQGYIARHTLYTDPEGTAGPRPDLTADTAHPQTCVTCHDPHNVGTTSGHGTNAPMRVVDNAYNLNAGFDATNVGKGAQCMTCHNSRRGLANDMVGLPNPDRAPHGGPQTDVVMGQNAFFVTVGLRGAHGFLVDSCVTCHLSLTPPPAELSYNLGGTNHTFGADTSICAECHGSFDPANLKAEFESSMHDFEMLLIDTVEDQIEALLDMGYTVQCDGHDHVDEDLDVSVTVTDVEDIDWIHITESHGRSAIDISVNGTAAYGCRLDSGTDILDGGSASQGSLALNGLFAGSFGPASDGPEVAMMKAFWNYFLLHSDGSHSYHNPGFAGEILGASFLQMNMLEWAPEDL